jgi:microcystin-dependent protein
MEEYIGTIKLYAGNYAPHGWAFCTGQLLPISQNTALFSVLGTNYGGDGRVTFGLPDLRGRVPVGAGQGNGLQYVELGAKAGSETVTLTAQAAAAGTVSVASSQPHNNVQPSLGLNFIICMHGLYPRRP